MNILERIYLAGHRMKTARDMKRARSLGLPVISVGNITAGGTGKTPAVISIAAEARARGLNPCVLTRGYRGRLRGPVFVSEENYARDVGDEPLLIASALHDVAVVKCADRYEAGIFALENLDERPGLFILDDGFQHQRLKRDLDLVLISATDPFGGGRLLPMGRLREPLEGLSRASVIVITKSALIGGDRMAELLDDIRGYNPKAPVFSASHQPSGVMQDVSLHAWGRENMGPVEWLSGKRVFAFCGLAEPGSFIAGLESAGATVAGSRLFGDHYQYGRGDIEEIEAEAKSLGVDWIMTTEKDIMRLRAMEKLPRNLVALAIEFRLEQEFLDYLFEMARRSDA